MVGDYFPNQTPQQLAKKKNLCQGAKPQTHSHFFTANGAFGSVDQHGEQVDDGTYQVNGSTLKIGNSDVSGSFRFRIQGKTLMLRPLLTTALSRSRAPKALYSEALLIFRADASSVRPISRSNLSPESS
jgi:hypothetical protein